MNMRLLGRCLSVLPGLGASVGCGGDPPDASAEVRNTFDAAAAVPDATDAGALVSDASAPDAVASAEEGGVIYADVETIFRDTGVGSWVSLSNQVSIVTVLSETRLSEPPAAAETNDLVGRNIELSLDENVWAPASADATLIASGSVFTMRAFGWAYSEGKLVRFVARNAVRMEVGGTYVVPLVEFLDSEDAWGVLTPQSVMALQGSAVAEEDSLEHDAGNSTTALLQDLDVAALSQALADAEMHPNAEKCRELPGTQRLACLSGS